MGKRAEYGRGHDEFIKYANYIVNHPNYRGMPDAFLDDERMQWEAPSNRTGGKFKDTNAKRYAWWKAKAKEVGIDPETENAWISKTARLIHPTKMKPCKACGRIMDIRYVYPTLILVKRIKKKPYISDSFNFNSYEPIQALVVRLYEQYGDSFLADLPSILTVKNIVVPEEEKDLKGWLTWIETEYIPREPRTLSPGAMANPPDRFDGFHSFNRCCRGREDKGRTKSNLQSYNTDRRVFEYWVDGDWIAADRLMGIIRSDRTIHNEACLNGHPGPCSADHIGPISLGFTHRAEFQLLCKNCNSAKNNRMSLSDVQLLLEAEKRQEVVASWFCLDLWNQLKYNVYSDENALRLSKILRDNRHNAIFLLTKILEKGHYVFLSTLLGLDYANYNISFPKLVIEKHVVRPGSIKKTKRKTKYATEQKARRMRIAFDALKTYFQKENRNAFVVATGDIEKKLIGLLEILEGSPEHIRDLDSELSSIIDSEIETSDKIMRKLVERVPSSDQEPEVFSEAKTAMVDLMNTVSSTLVEMWDSDRYVRDTYSFEEG